MATTLLKQKSREYKDIAFSMIQHPETKNLLIKSNINSVKQAVINLLTLQKGDKQFHPEIRSPIYGYLFELMGVLEKVVLEQELRTYLNTYEPRLLVESINIDFPNPNALNCEVVGSLINTSEPFTVNVLIDRLR